MPLRGRPRARRFPYRRDCGERAGRRAGATGARLLRDGRQCGAAVSGAGLPRSAHAGGGAQGCSVFDQPMRAILRASSFFISMLDWRAIMMRWACGEPAPCMDSGR